MIATLLGGVKAPSPTRRAEERQEDTESRVAQGAENESGGGEQHPADGEGPGPEPVGEMAGEGGYDAEAEWQEEVSAPAAPVDCR